MHTAGGETVVIERSSSGFGRLTVSLHRVGQSAFLTAAQLRQLAREAAALATALEADAETEEGR